MGGFKSHPSRRVFTFPAKPMTEEELVEIATKEWDKISNGRSDSIRNVIRALRDAGALYCSEEKK